jgi:hypothetical protein
VVNLIGRDANEVVNKFERDWFQPAHPPSA